MESLFPGMNPYIEDQAWETFHNAMITHVMGQLSHSVGERYVVRVELRVYLEHVRDETKPYRPDVAVMGRREQGSPGRGLAAVAEPVLVPLVIPAMEEEAYLTVRIKDSLELVTVIEVLSPGNKRPGSDGRREYNAKRDAILRTSTHLVEVDLLRGGLRIPTDRPLPPAAYYAIVSRAEIRPQAEVYPCGLRDPLPSIRVPLLPPDLDVVLDLQSAVDDVNESAAFDRTLNYDDEVDSPLSDEDANWVRDIIVRSR